VPGQELSGTIERVGAGVTTRRPGQPFTPAPASDHIAAGIMRNSSSTPADATFLLPDTVTFDATATLANYQVAYHIFNDAVRLRKGQRVLIYAAAGGMGNALIDLAKAADLVVIGVVSGEEKSKFSLSSPRPRHDQTAIRRAAKAATGRSISGARNREPYPSDGRAVERLFNFTTDPRNDERTRPIGHPYCKHHLRSGKNR
jgi:NADPH:quinone reductase-like Zn-dependent oxidoreductase